MLIYPITALIGAFLLFQVQPLIGKSLLPWFGGSPLVWTTCLMFFQALLLAGYAYAHLIITRLGPRGQLLTHLTVLTLGLAFSMVLPGSDWAPDGHEQPTVHLLSILLVHVGVPFFALSTTAPLLQAWFHGKYPDRSPYPLYAVSNAGSLLAVLSYPFIFEPLWPLASQEKAWFITFIVFYVGCAACTLISRRSLLKPSKASNEEGDAGDVKLTRPIWSWLGLSACGSVLLLATTDQISQDLAASPLFWVLPLCLYLLSFILCFARDGFYRRKIWLTLLPFAAVAVTGQLIFGGRWPAVVQLALYTSTLFVGCMVCHGELARLRPRARHLTGYYLSISLGGLLGGVFVALLAPWLFPGMWEYPLGWLGLYTLTLVLLQKDENLPFHKDRFSLVWVLFGSGWFIAAACFVADVVMDHRDAGITSRNFYGRLAVSQKRDKRCLYHGRIRHGCQWTDRERALQPTTYYGYGSGVGLSVGVLRVQMAATKTQSLRIGVAGLGVGTCAAWGEPGDVIRFYEISPAMVRLAKTQFSYLSGSAAKVEIEVGDARLAMEREAEKGLPSFDLLVLDAFNGDAVPLHLLTREAFDSYWRRLKPEGVLAAHISNRHVNLEPLLLGLSGQLGMEPLLIHTDDDPKSMAYASTWVLVTRNVAFIEAVRAGGYAEPWPEKYAMPIVFTDQHSNILKLLW